MKVYAKVYTTGKVLERNPVANRSYAGFFFLFQILFPYRLLHNTEYSSLGYTVDACWFSTFKPFCLGDGGRNTLGDWE